MNLKAKLRPFYVAQMLYERTDEEHYLTIVQMMEILEKEYGISTSRGTVSDDIKVLQEFGLEIEVELSTQNRYYLIGRRFDLPELKLLIDAVESARFITKEKSDALVKKITSLSSIHNATALTRNIDVENRIKSDNERIYYVIDVLNEAVGRKKKVSFQYFTYNVKKQKKLKHDGYIYILSPYKLVWNGDYYYVVGYSEKHNEIGNFRLDRIAKLPDILDEDAANPPKGFNLNTYLNSMFRMYNGQRNEVELICDNDVMDAIIDKFGKDVKVLANDMESFRVIVNTAVSSIFYRWIFGFEGKVRIKGPECVKEQYRQMVENVAKNMG